jgi:hypothetical protein
VDVWSPSWPDAGSPISRARRQYFALISHVRDGYILCPRCLCLRFESSGTTDDELKKIESDCDRKWKRLKMLSASSRRYYPRCARRRGEKRLRFQCRQRLARWH